MKFKRFESLIVVGIIVVVAGTYAFTKKPVQAPVTDSQQTQNQNLNQPVQQVPSSEIKYQGVEGKTAMELLKATHRVDVKNYSFGDMVTGIDGIEPDNNHFWGFYVNGSLSQVGADQYKTKASDSIEWKLEEIKF
ncbi:MAG: DUF4430 domain-containing protein [Acidobacteriaceae bacterium]